MLWNTFDGDRKHLEAQYHDPPWDETSGCSVDRLEQSVAQMVQEAERKGQPRICTKAEVFALLLSNARIEVDPRDWFADRLQHAELVARLRDSWTEEIRQTAIAEADTTATNARLVGAYIAAPNFSHTAPDWERMLALGPSGLLNCLRQTRQERLASGCLTGTQRDFYAAAETVYIAFIQFILRLAEAAEKQAALHQQQQVQMLAVAECLRNIATRPPATLHEALQLAYLCHELMEMEGESVRSMGGFDRLYYRFYQSDLNRGIRTRDQQKELIKYFFIKFFARTGGLRFGKNFVFGGLTPDGSDAVNPLSYAALEAYEEMRTVDPKLSIRVHPGTPDAMFRQVAGCIRSGCSSFVLVNDEVGISALVKRGVPEHEARDYVLMGCYEPAILGKEVPCSGSQWVNIAKAVEWALNGGLDPLTGRQMGPQTGACDTFRSFDQFYAAFKRQLSLLLEQAMDVQVAYESLWGQMNTSPLLSATMVECVERGRDISAGGAKYNNTGCCVASLASTVDALMAVHDLVFESRTISMCDLAEALKSNWTDNELLRLKVLHSRHKFGNSREEPDALACDIAGYVAGIINGRQNERGGRFCAALNSIDHCHGFGIQTGALPDGRRAHEPLSKNLSAVTGMDREGVTALIGSVTRLDFTRFPNGSVLDIILHPSAVQGEEGLAAMVGLIRSYFALGGFGIQFNIFDADTLRQAQQNPEQYATLQVRVCGWNVHFVNLSRHEQDAFIRQAEHLSV